MKYPKQKSQDCQRWLCSSSGSELKGSDAPRLDGSYCHLLYRHASLHSASSWNQCYEIKNTATIIKDFWVSFFFSPCTTKSFGRADRTQRPFSTLGFNAIEYNWRRVCVCAALTHGILWVSSYNELTFFPRLRTVDEHGTPKQLVQWSSSVV